MTDDLKDLELLVFIGFPGDAAAEANAIWRVRQALNDALEKATERDEQPVFMRVKVWKWDLDADARPRGQDGIDPTVEKAHFGVFVFKHRVGEYTLHELELFRHRDDAPPLAAYFTSVPPDDVMTNRTAMAEVLALQDLKVSLHEWSGPRPVLPQEDYASAEDLAASVVAVFEQNLTTILDQAEEAVRSESPDERTPVLATNRQPKPPSIAEYKAAVAEQHSLIELAGFGDTVRVPIQVKDLYVRLHAHVDLRGSGPSEFSDADEAAMQIALREGQGEIALTEAFQHANNLGGQRGIVILGDPGSGKTTLLKRLLLWVLKEDPVAIGLPEDIVPLFLPLRDLGSVDDTLEDFVEQSLKRAGLAQEGGLARAILDHKNVLFLLDGLDEVPDEATRKKVSQWIARLLQSHRAARVAVTCRYAGYKKETRLPREFLELHLRPLETEQAEEFIRKWYHAVECGLSLNKAQAKEEAESRSEKLIERLAQKDFRARRVYELTRNPLLLTTICLVHRDRGDLPHGRANLYAVAVSILLERWRGRLGESTDVAQILPLLQPIAHRMHDGGHKRASEEDVITWLESALAQSKLSGQSARTFVHSIRDHGGLMTGWSDDSYGFMHLGFQEYLTACEIRRRHFEEDENLLTELAERADDSWWQEVILLLLGMGNPSAFTPFVRAFLRTAAFTEKPEFLGFCFDDSVSVSAAPLIECLDDDSVDPTTQAQILQTLQRRLPDDAKTWEEKNANHRLMRTPASAAKTGGGNVWVHDESGYEMVAIPGGTITIEGETHDVAPFWLGRTPVTNKHYGRFLESSDLEPPKFWGDRNFNQPDQPVVGVSWHDAVSFCEWAGLVLPTEAQWEHACRAGTTTTEYWSGDSEEDLARVGWYRKNSTGRLQTVAEKPANPYGLHDMHGNVWEWCADKYDAAFRVLRGGSWSRDAVYCRSAFRHWDRPSERWVSVGFRPARVSPPSS